MKKYKTILNEFKGTTQPTISSDVLSLHNEHSDQDVLIPLTFEYVRHAVPSIHKRVEDKNRGIQIDDPNQQPC